MVRSPDEWCVIVSPVRAEIVEALRLLGPCSAAEIAAAIGRPADSLYKHVELLQKAGVVVDAGFRKGERNVEQLVDQRDDQSELVADDFAIDFQDATGADENKAIVTTVNSFCKAMIRAVRDSAKARQLEFHPEKRNLAINYELSWLTEEAFQEFRGLVRRMKQLMDDGKKRREGRLYMSLIVATPVTRKRGAGERKPKSTSPARSGKSGATKNLSKTKTSKKGDSNEKS